MEISEDKLLFIDFMAVELIIKVEYIVLKVVGSSVVESSTFSIYGTGSFFLFLYI